MKATAQRKNTHATQGFTVLAVMLSSVLVEGAYGAQNTFSPSRLAVVRPFSLGDTYSLSSSFDAWKDFTPCSSEHSSPLADLFLVYSQSYETSPEAQEAANAVTAKFHETEGWDRCFSNVIAIDVNIAPNLDIYEPSEQNTNNLWVNGPNRHWERTIRKIQSGEWGTYESMYLMEIDSAPVKPFWLDILLSEVEQNRPFAILGSKYNGDKWDSFYDQLPSALVNHINGNAVYNVTHPILNEIVSQLEAEATTSHNSIPYDYRISQINEEKASQWKDQDPIKETKAILNYAATNILPQHIGDEVIVHGANIYHPWNSKKESITLVVSDWHGEQSSYLLSHLDDGAYPFSSVVLMLPPDTEAPSLHGQSPSTPVTIYNRQHSEPDYMDLCSAPVTTDWFMLTNSYHRLVPNLSLMVTAEGKPVITFAPATEEYCYKFPSCKESIANARSIYPSQDSVFQDYDMIYSTKERDDMCKLWIQTHGVDGRRRMESLDSMSHESDASSHAAVPTATVYAAYLASKGLADDLYSFSDRTIFGSRNAFVRVFPYPSPESHGHRRLLESSASNSTGCELLVTQDECQQSDLECEWRSNFDSCHASNGNTTSDFYVLSMTLNGVGSLSDDAVSSWEEVTSYHVASYYDLENGAQDVETEIISQSAQSTAPSRQRRMAVVNTVSYRQRFTSASAKAKVAEVAEATESAPEDALTAPFSEEADVASYVTLLQESSAEGETNEFSDMATVSNMKVVAVPATRPDGSDPSTPSDNGDRRKGLIALIAGITGGAVVLTALIAVFLWRRSRAQQHDMIYELDSSSGTNDGIGDDTDSLRLDGDERMRTVPLEASEFDV